MRSLRAVTRASESGCFDHSAESPEGERPAPMVLQAEAYCGEHYLAIRNERTEPALVLTRHHFPGPIGEAPDFAAFLDATAAWVANNRVIVALGDSRTANFSNWPRALQQRHFAAEPVCVVNLADWARCNDDHVAVVDYYLQYLWDQGAAEAAVVAFGCLYDFAHRMYQYQRYDGGFEPTPLLGTELRLAEHRYARDLMRLCDMVPFGDDEREVTGWVGRRVRAVVAMLERLCADAGCDFFAILEPLAYPDLSPAYGRALRRAYLDAAPVVGFEAWCQAGDHYTDPSAFMKLDVRPAFDRLRASWRLPRTGSQLDRYIDWSDMFRDLWECPFEARLDAVHYSALGSELIADAIYRLLQSKWNLPSPRSAGAD